MAIEMQAEGSSQRPDPRTLTTLPEILSSLSALEAEETELSNSLSDLLSDREPVMNALTRLQALEPRLNELHSEAYLLSGTVSATAKTADRVGGRVRLLDEEMKRVREAGERVGQVMELKVSRASASLCDIGLTLKLSLPLGVADSSSICYGNTRLGVRDSPLRTRHGAAVGRDLRRIRRILSGEHPPTHTCCTLSCAERSPVQKARCHLRKRCRTRAKSFSASSATSSRRLLRRGTQPPQRGTSSYFLLLDGKRRVYKLTHLSLWTSSKYAHRPPLRVSFSLALLQSL
jgi:hypothetical protein